MVATLVASRVAGYVSVMREHIISEIQRLATLSGGQAPGSQAFVSATGITESKWRGKYWARWGDALVEAGFKPNTLTEKSDAGSVLAGVVAACRHYGHFPTNSEMALLRSADPSIPPPKTIRANIGGQAEVAAALRQHLGEDPAYEDVRAMVPEAPAPAPPAKSAKAVDGHVYLIRSGDFYKVGRSDELERRVKEIRVALPDAATLVHAITTDDPPGIEAYWHRRFADRRANGEWFKLSADDVKAFLRRKFQ